MKRRLIIGLSLAMAAASLRAQGRQDSGKWIEDFEKRFPKVSKNAAAEELERLSLALGIDSHQEHPTEEDLDAYVQADFPSWLNAQLKAADDSIGPPPSKLKQFLERRQGTISRVVSLLVREVPEWGFDIREKPRDPYSKVLISVRINRILLSAALVEERLGRHSEAGQYLEASWSLSRSLTERPELISMLIAVAMAREQAGTVRKMSETPFQWMERLSGDGPRQQILAAFENALLIAHAYSDEPVEDGYLEASARAWHVFADTLLKSSPCEVSKLSAEEIVDPLVQELKKLGELGVLDPEAQAEFIRENAGPEIVNALRRATRLLVDRELTLRILQLRQEKAAAHTDRWPENLSDPSSKVCPELSYEYHARGAVMAIRFQGYVVEPDSPGLILPLSFEVRPSQPPPTPKRSRPRVLDSIFLRK